MSKQKEVNSYIVLKRGGMSNGICLRTRGRYRVGARSEKDALEYCRQQVDPTGGYRVYYKEEGKTFPKGMVVLDRGTDEPYVEMDGEMYITTEEYKYEDSREPDVYSAEESAIVLTRTVYRKYVKRYARKESDVKWVEVSVHQGQDSIERASSLYGF